MKKKVSQQKQTKSNKKTKKIVVCILVAAILITSGYLSFAIFRQIEGFSKEKLLNQEASVQISIEDNKEYYSYSSEGTKKNVPYDDIPQVMIDAVVAAEDSRFFEHNGFDMPRILKALMGNIIARDITGGGSTITQQVIKKSYYPDEERTIQRKIGEVILSIEATSQTTKEEILELYLNKIYFGKGNNTIGIYAASRYYFDKDVQDLTLPEAALLAGTINSPVSYDPFRNLDLATKRRNIILDLMALHGYITEEERDITKKIPLQNILKSNPISVGGKYQAYADMVTREVKEKTGLDPSETSMKIYTYMNTSLQGNLDDIANGKSYQFYDKDIQIGACVQDTHNGRIVGVLSSRDYQTLGMTNAYSSLTGNKTGGYGQRHQPGSSLKPIISYASAFEFLDYSTAHYVHDTPYSAGGWTPKNFDNKYHGDLSISNALSHSYNLAAINTFSEVLNEIGKDEATKYLEGFGFNMEGENVDLAMSIGGWAYGVTPKEEAGAYAAISNGGTYIEPHTVEKIEIISTGEVIRIDENANNAKKQALTEESAFMIRSVMTDYVKTSSSYSALNIGYQIGAKTGTTNYPNDSSVPSALRGKSKDSWMTAYSPDYAWSVWTGYPETIAKEKGKYLKSGHRDSRAVSKLIAKYVHNGKLQNKYSSQPEGVVKAQCVSGIYPYVSVGSNIPSDRIVTGYFKANNIPSGTISGSKINELTAFNATVKNNKIIVQFKEYDPVSMTKDGAKPTKTYKVGGHSYTLPYYGDPNQLLGKVVYVVEVTDVSGQVIYTEKLNIANATLKYTPNHGQYNIIGYYAIENSTNTSNKLTVPIVIEAPVEPEPEPEPLPLETE